MVLHADEEHRNLLESVVFVLVAAARFHGAGRGENERQGRV